MLLQKRASQIGTTSAGPAYLTQAADSFLMGTQPGSGDPRIVNAGSAHRRLREEPLPMGDRPRTPHSHTGRRELPGASPIASMEYRLSLPAGGGAI
jgi:hypothetical protein